MNDILTLVRDHWHIALVGVIAGPPMLLGFLPSLVLRLGLLLYPKDHEKRAEFLAEQATVPWRERPLWVAGLLPHCLFEGPPARIQRRRETRLRRRLQADVARIIMGMPANGLFTYHGDHVSEDDPILSLLEPGSVNEGEFDTRLYDSTYVLAAARTWPTLGKPQRGHRWRFRLTRKDNPRRCRGD